MAICVRVRDHVWTSQVEVGKHTVLRLMCRLVRALCGKLPDQLDDGPWCIVAVVLTHPIPLEALLTAEI